MAGGCTIHSGLHVGRVEMASRMDLLYCFTLLLAGQSLLDRLRYHPGLHLVLPVSGSLLADARFMPAVFQKKHKSTAAYNNPPAVSWN